MTFDLNRGVLCALAAAALFGAGTPFAKLLLAHTDPWLLAALLYLGSGLGLALLRRLRRAPGVQLARAEWGWLSAATLAGGVVAPVLLMFGLVRMPATGASLLLNAEGVLTALLAWFVFKENFDRRVALGMAAIVAGALVLSWPGGTGLAGSSGVSGVSSAAIGIDGIDGLGGLGALAVLGACLAWAIDNNLTRKVALADASFIAMFKGLGAGSTNLFIAWQLGSAWPALPTLGGAALLGFLSYGASLVLFVVALRHLGTARTGAYFSVAPFFGALLGVALLGETLTAPVLVAGALMAVGVWLHLTEQHGHWHTHEAIEHSHAHSHGPDHDGHHDHVHAPGTADAAGHNKTHTLTHTHVHAHTPNAHSHTHHPDAHHRHTH